MDAMRLWGVLWRALVIIGIGVLGLALADAWPEQARTIVFVSGFWSALAMRALWK